jgi:uncharacterized protein YjaG (DUF416 family)
MKIRRMKLKKTWEDRESPMLMNQKNEYLENACTTKCNLHVQWNIHQKLSDIPHRDIKINPKLHIETRKILNSQNNTQQNSNSGDIIISVFNCTTDQ